MRIPYTYLAACAGIGASTTAEHVKTNATDPEVNLAACYVNELEDISGNWAALEESCGYNLRRVSGELRIKIAKIEEDFVVSDETLKDIVEDSASYWNQKMWDIDPTVQLRVDPEETRVDCDNIKATDVANNEMIICVPSNSHWNINEANLHVLEGITTLYGKSNYGFSTKVEKGEVTRFYTGGSVIKLHDAAFKGAKGVVDDFMVTTVKHEMGHVLGLEHNKNEDDNLMGRLKPRAAVNEKGIVEGLTEIYAN